VNDFSFPTCDSADAPDGSDEQQPDDSPLVDSFNGPGLSDLFRLPESVVLYDGDRAEPVRSASFGSSPQGISSPDGGSALVTNTSGTGLIIHVSYDSSVGNAPAGFTNVVSQVVQYFQSHFNDPVTININVGYGEVHSSRLSAGALGESSTYLSSVGYDTLTSQMALDAKTAADNSAVASLPGDPNGGAYWVSTAEGKALGLIGATTTPDGFVGFSSSSNIFDYNNADGVGAGQYDFFGVVAHEFSEVMGRMLLVGETIGNTSNSYDPLDLLHFSSSGVHDFLGSTAGYFSADNGATPLNSFNTVAGGDYGDWAGATVDAFNAYANTGAVLPISAADLTAMDVIGWDAGASASPPQQPDFTISNLALNLSAGGTSVGFSVNNVGGADASASTTGFYLSTDSIITASDRFIGSASTPFLSAGASDGEAGSISLPTNLTPGTYYIGVLADSPNAIAESNEGNNASTAVPVIVGNSSGNTLKGAAGNDTMFGLGGNDTLIGGAGNDTLIGGAGNDHFRFAAATDGMDSIVDFASGADRVDFARTVFGSHLAVNNLNTGILNPTHFIASDSGPVTSAQEFWYDTASHVLYFDADGSGAGAAIAMAQFGSTIMLASTDIHLI